MFRFLLRCLSGLCLFIAVIFALLDSARSVGASQLVTKSLSDIWADNAPDSLDIAHDYLTANLGAGVWQNLHWLLLQWPGWILFGMLALLFYCASYKRVRRLGRFSA